MAKKSFTPETGMTFSEVLSNLSDSPIRIKRNKDDGINRILVGKYSFWLKNAHASKTLSKSFKKELESSEISEDMQSEHKFWINYEKVETITW